MKPERLMSGDQLGRWDPRRLFRGRMRWVTFPLIGLALLAAVGV